MQTFRPAPEQTIKIFNWVVHELENNKGYEFITPQGYIFGLASKHDVFEFVAHLTWGGMSHDTMYGDIHNVIDGVIEAWKPDPWINKDWAHEDKICRVSHFVDTAMAYAQLKWIN